MDSCLTPLCYTDVTMGSYGFNGWVTVTLLVHLDCSNSSEWTWRHQLKTFNANKPTCSNLMELQSQSCRDQKYKMTESSSQLQAAHFNTQGNTHLGLKDSLFYHACVMHEEAFFLFQTEPLSSPSRFLSFMFSLLLFSKSSTFIILSHFPFLCLFFVFCPSSSVSLNSLHFNISLFSFYKLKKTSIFYVSIFLNGLSVLTL